MNKNACPSALVVEGGAMRGIFASGVLDAFIEHDYRPFDFAIGVSAGATNLLAYLASQHGRSHDILTELACSQEFMDPLRFAKGGNLVDIEWLWNTSCRKYPLDIHTYRETGIPFYAVVTNTLTGKAEYIRVKPENMNEVLPASCAIPLAYREYPEVHGVPMTDGGVADSIPVLEAYRRGARHMTVILSEPLGYRLKPMPFSWMLRTLLKTRPALAHALEQRDRSYNEALDFIANPPDDCQIEVIAPADYFPVSRFTRDINKLEMGYMMGKCAGYQASLLN
ncbi:patatin-like phospholipase family protein [Aeromonas sp. 164P]